MKIKKPYNYTEYLAYAKLLTEDTVFAKQKYDESKQEFFLLNYKRMERLNNTFNVDENLTIDSNIKQVWIIITEPWCGDSAQSIPIIEKIANKFNDHIKSIYLTRDDESEWISRFNTNGSLSIPKLISFNASDVKYENPLFVWGARPAPAVEIYNRWKPSSATIPKTEFEKELHTWYAQDKGKTIFSEIWAMLNRI